MKRRIIEKWDTYQYVPYQFVPLLSSLKKLLADNTVIEEIKQCPQRIHLDNLLEDFCDGSRFSSHALFLQDPYALQILAYDDELDICNP